MNQSGASHSESAGAIKPSIGIMKSLWSRRPDGIWEVSSLKGLDLKPRPGFAADYFKVASDIELVTRGPLKDSHAFFASFGATEFLLAQSILPVVAWNEGDEFMRTIGTAYVISCTGYVMTAAHVIMDPLDEGYGAKRRGERVELSRALNFGVFIPYNPAYGQRGATFFPFEKHSVWGNWTKSPLFNEPPRFELSTDVAICKIPEQPHRTPHQPLNLSLNPFVPREAAYSIGYAEMVDIPIDVKDGSIILSGTKPELYVSVGTVSSVFPRNHTERNLPTPGPCFDFEANIPGKMSGAPIFGAHGAVVRGVVSRSLGKDHQHATGAMLGPAMELPLEGGQTLRSLMEGNEGMAQVQGYGL